MGRGRGGGVWGGRRGGDRDGEGGREMEGMLGRGRGTKFRI